MISSTNDRVESLRCSARTHAKIRGPDRNIVSHRCVDAKCPEYVYAEQHNLVAIHRWDLDDPALTCHTTFEEKPRQRRIR